MSVLGRRSLGQQGFGSTRGSTLGAKSSDITEEVCYKWKWITGTAYATLVAVWGPEDFGEDPLPYEVIRTPEGQTPNLATWPLDPNKYQERWVLCVGATYYEECKCFESEPSEEGEEAEGPQIGPGGDNNGPCGRSQEEHIESEDNCKCKARFTSTMTALGGTGGSTPIEESAGEGPHRGYTIDFCCELGSEPIRFCEEADDTSTSGPGGGSDTYGNDPYDASTPPDTSSVRCNCQKHIRLPKEEHFFNTERGSSLHENLGQSLDYTFQFPSGSEKERERLLCQLLEQVLERLSTSDSAGGPPGHGDYKDISLCGECEEAANEGVAFDEDEDTREMDECDGFPGPELQIFGF